MWKRVPYMYWEIVFFKNVIFPTRTLHDAEAKVKVIISKRFDEAVGREDLASVERFFKIFPLINMHQEGLKKFTNYLCAKVKYFSKKF